MPGQVDIEVARLVGDFRAHPVRQRNRLTFFLELDLGDHQAGILALEFVDHPFSTVHRQVMSHLLDQRPLAEPLQHFRRVAPRNFVLVLGTSGAVLRPLSGEKGAVAHDAYPNRPVGRGAEIALANLLPSRATPPGVAVDQKLALDLDRHGAALSPRVRPTAARVHSSSSASPPFPLQLQRLIEIH
jgi:hypothetical protein